jgi:hypothetical protein
MVQLSRKSEYIFIELALEVTITNEFYSTQTQYCKKARQLERT